MSEMMEYSGSAVGFETDAEREAFVELAEAFQSANVDVIESTGAVQFWVTNGWRGGGYTCEEIVQGHFDDWLEAHPHVSIEVWATYVEHAPTEQVFVRGEA